MYISLPRNVIPVSEEKFVYQEWDAVGWRQQKRAPDKE